MKIYSETKIYEGLGYTPENVEEIERRAREEGTTAGATDGYNDGYESGRTDYEAYKAEYFTVEALSAGTLNVYHNSQDTTSILFYMVNDDENWIEVPRRPAQLINPSTSITLSAGDKVKFKGTLKINQDLLRGSTLSMNAYGNIQSLYFDDDFSGETTCQFSPSLFNDCTGLVDASNLILPSTTLLQGCYYQMFSNCSSLTGRPELIATTLAPFCYMGMFQGCSSLTSVPELPVTTLTNRCYTSMFAGCTSLTTAPELPATTLADNCYEYMFSNCSSLTAAPELPATTATKECYKQMFEGCTNLIQAPALPATTLASGCYSNMFAGCTGLTTAAPELPATTLTHGCYSNMFSGCTNLATAPELPATTLAYACYYGMFMNCTSLTTAPALPATTLQTMCYMGMFYGCTSLNSITCLATDIPDSQSTFMWVDGVSSTGTFAKAASMSSWTTGTSGIPEGWTVIDAE